MSLISRFKNFVLGTATRVNYVYMSNVVNGSISNTIDYIKKAYKLNADVYAITSFIAGKVATVPFVLYEVKSQKDLMRYKAMSAKDFNREVMKVKDRALVEASDTHRIIQMLNVAPNDYMTANEWKTGWVLYRLLTGNTYVRGFGPEAEPEKFVEMHLLPTQFTEPIGGTQFHGPRYYRQTFNAEQIDARHVSHSKYFNPDFEWPGNPHIVGMAPLEAAAKVTQRSNSGYESSTMAFENGGVTGVLYQDGGADLSEPQRQDLQKHIDNKVSGARNYKQLLAASSKMGYLKIGETPVDLDILSSLLSDLRSLCNVFHLNSALFNDPDNKSYNNVSEARKAAITDAVLPELTAMRDALNLWLVPGWEKADGKKYFIDFDASVFPELQTNMKETAEWLDKAWWLTPNEKRAQQDYDDAGPEYDQIFVPMGVSPLSASDPNEDSTDFQKSYEKFGNTDY